VESNSSIEQSLLREGAASYWLARAAIKEYQALVCRRCREVVEAERDHIVAAVGSPLKALKDFEAFEASTHYAALGITASGSNGCNHFFALWWEKDKLYASVWTMFKDNEKRRRAWLSLQEVHSKESAGSNATEIWLRLEIPTSDAGNPWSHMSNCIREWSQMWGRVPGGLNQYL
jgi:hypothetical protein